MKPSSPTGSRRTRPSSPARRPTKKAGPTKRTADLSSGAKKRTAPGRRPFWMNINLISWVVFGLANLVMVGAATGVYSECYWVKGEIVRKNVILKELQSQKKAARAKLNVLSGEEGRERLLVANGYLKPGDRLLLFPPGGAVDPKVSHASTAALEPSSYMQRIKKMWHTLHFG